MDTPQVLLDHHLKILRLPTFLREYDKLAQQCAAEGVDFPRYLLRLSELELLDRERRATERRIRQAKFDVVKSLDTFEFLAIPSLNKSLVLDLARCEFIERKENILALGNRQNAHRSRPGSGGLPERFPRPVHDRGVAGARTDRGQGRTAPDALSENARQLRATHHRLM